MNIFASFTAAIISIFHATFGFHYVPPTPEATLPSQRQIQAIPPVIQAALNWHARIMNVSPSDVSVVSFSNATWSDSCMGAAGEGDVCSGQTINGYRVYLKLNDQKDYIYEVHVDQTGRMFAELGALGQVEAKKILSNWVGDNSTVSVPGMSKYTDPDFGFSFWHPSGWHVYETGGMDGDPTMYLDIENGKQTVFEIVRTATSSITEQPISTTMTGLPIYSAQNANK